jgi:biopolymer transport protein ExbB
MDFFTTIVRFFQEGGIFMYPIVVVLALGAAIALERYLFLTMSKESIHKCGTSSCPWSKEVIFNRH